MLFHLEATSGAQRARQWASLLLSRQRARSGGGGAAIRDIDCATAALAQGSSWDMNVVTMSGPRPRRMDVMAEVMVKQAASREAVFRHSLLVVLLIREVSFHLFPVRRTRHNADPTHPTSARALPAAHAPACPQTNSSNSLFSVGGLRRRVQSCRPDVVQRRTCRLYSLEGRRRRRSDETAVRCSCV